MTAKYNLVSLLSCVLFTGQLAAVVEEPNVFEGYDIIDYKEQLYSSIIPVELGLDEKGEIIYYNSQAVGSKYLYLGPNEVFFTPIGDLKLGGVTENDDVLDSRGSEYQYIGRFRQEQDSIEWGFITSNTGAMVADFFIEGASNDAGIIFSMQIDDNTPQEVTITSEMLNDKHFTLAFSDVSEGFHVFKGTLIKRSKPASLKIFNVRLSGEAILDSYVVKERWRPEAVYSEWSSSNNLTDVKAWIIELYSDSQLGHYSPITTNFGYFGPIFKPGGSALNMNMSIWSSGDNEALLPIDLRSHLLGIGSSEGIFGSWGHEGTGVKVRDWDNFKDNTSQKYVVGLRYEIDGEFTTFYGYFWNEATSKWQLYSVGRKHRDEILSSLKTKAFIEVVGGASEERSNHQERRVNYRGWVRNSEGNWSSLDTFDIPKRKEVSNQYRGISEDGEYFFSATGGYRSWFNNDPSSQLHKPEASELPVYMRERNIADFDKLPFVPKITKALITDDGMLTVNFQTQTLNAATVTICYGSENAQTNQVFWENSTTIDVPAGKRRKVHTAKIALTPEVRYVRILVQDGEAQMWNFDSYDLEAL